MPREFIKTHGYSEDNMENTPSKGQSLEYLIDRARRMALRYVEISPYRPNW